jgi:hypothetical protein
MRIDRSDRGNEGGDRFFVRGFFDAAGRRLLSPGVRRKQ